MVGRQVLAGGGSQHRLQLVETESGQAAAPETVWRAPLHGRIAARNQSGIVVLNVRDVWAFEARDRLCFVHSAGGRFDVDVSLAEIEATLGRGFMRVHRGWLANVGNVRELDRDRGGHFLVVGAMGSHRDACMRVPVSREHAGSIRARLLVGTIGFRQRRRAASPRSG